MIQSRRMRWGGYVACGLREMHIWFSIGKPGRKRPLGIHRFKWEDNVKTDLRELR
jgi:hypothetical protein